MIYQPSPVHLSQEVQASGPELLNIAGQKMEWWKKGNNDLAEN